MSEFIGSLENLFYLHRFIENKQWSIYMSANFYDIFIIALTIIFNMLLTIK